MRAKESNEGMTRHAGLLSFLTGLSRILGVLRESVMAYLFGAGPAVDAFVVAYRLPNLLRRLFAEGALSISFIPVFARYLNREGEDSARRFANSAFTILSAVLLLVTVLGILLAPVFIYIMAPGFLENEGKFALTVSLARVMFPFIFSIGIVTLMAGVLNTYDHFFAPALAPVVLNISIIACSFAFYAFFNQPIYSMAAGVLVGGILQVFVQLPSLSSRGYKLRIVRTTLHPGVKEASRLFFPATFGAAVYQINIVLTQILASFLPEGSVAFLWYANRFFELPLGVFAVSIATVSLPRLSLLASEGRMDEWKNTINYALGFTFFITFPAMVGLIILGEPIIRVLFEVGQFTRSDTRNTAIALFYYTLGLWSVGGSRVFVQAFYSIKDTMTPVKVAFIAFVVNIIASIVLMKSMEHAGLALATTIASIVNFLPLVILLRIKAGRLGFSLLFNSLVKILIASGVMGIFLWYAYNSFLRDITGRWAAAGIITVLIALSLIIYAGVSYLLRSNELKTVMETISRKP
ncbi:MAG TPA: murein biosynthesis integral membrane protein MurJ [bacterium]